VQNPTPILETDRLILRLPQAGDFDSWADYAGDAEAARYLGGPVPRSGAWRQMCTFAGAWTVRGFSMFSVIEKATGRWVGRLGPWQPEGWPGTEVGWGIVRDAWGKGYATEGATAAIDWAFATLGWDRVVHCIDPENVNSQRVAQRLGSTILERTNLPAPLDSWVVDVWGQTREAWLARRRG
jgi:RimJ/RimL family protein N-acetyltransferase